MPLMMPEYFSLVESSGSNLQKDSAVEKCLYDKTGP